MAQNFLQTVQGQSAAICSEEMTVEKLHARVASGNIQGIYSNIPNEIYHAGPGISKSKFVKCAAESPKHLKDSEEHEAWKKENGIVDEAECLSLGGALHAIILEPDTFANRYVFEEDFLPDGKTRRDSKYQEQKRAYLQQGISIIEKQSAGSRFTSKQTLDKMVLNLKNHPRAGKAIDPAFSIFEHSVYWTDSETGILCKCRPDIICRLNDQFYLFDIKTTRDASPEEFGRDAFKYAYTTQASFYSDGFKAVTGINPALFAFICVESSSPFDIALYSVSDEDIIRSRALYKRGMRLYKQCKETNNWTGYKDEFVPLELPAWAKRNDKYWYGEVQKGKGE